MLHLRYIKFVVGEKEMGNGARGKKEIITVILKVIFYIIPKDVVYLLFI